MSILIVLLDETTPEAAAIALERRDDRRRRLGQSRSEHRRRQPTSWTLRGTISGLRHFLMVGKINDDPRVAEWRAAQAETMGEGRRAVEAPLAELPSQPAALEAKG